MFTVNAVLSKSDYDYVVYDDDGEYILYNGTEKYLPCKDNFFDFEKSEDSEAVYNIRIEYQNEVFRDIGLIGQEEFEVLKEFSEKQK